MVKGIETRNFDSAMKAAALAGSEGFKWGAISGAVVGGASKAILLNRPIPSPRKAELDALATYGGSDQLSYINGTEVPFGTPGSTRPDVVRNVGGVLEAIEVKCYNLQGSANRGVLKSELIRQISQRSADLPNGSLQRIVLNVQGRGYSKQFASETISWIQDFCNPFYPNIPVDIMGAVL